MPPGAERRVAVWDLPTRAFHGLLILLFALLWWSGKNERFDIHLVAGLTMLGLLVFRLIWGLIGGSTARFASFVRGPGAVIAYLRGRSAPAHGHNPLGGWSVLAMLLMLSVQVGLGLFSSDEDALHTGPLSDLVSFESAQRLLENHDTMFDILLILVGLHVAAVLYYRLRGDDLVRPMIDGRRSSAEGLRPLRPAPAWRFGVAILLAAALPLWLAYR